MQNDNQEKTTQQLQNRIQQQKVTIEKLKAEQKKISQYVVQFKTALKRKKQKQQSDAIKKSQQTQQKLQNQLLKQIQTAKTILKNYQHDLKNIQKKTKMSCTPDDLLKLQEQIKEKSNQNKSNEDQIKDLKFLKKKLQKIIQNKQKSDVNENNKLSKLTEQIKRQKQVLQSFKTKNIKKEQNLQKKKTQILQLQQQYSNYCKKTGQKPILFEDYKEKRKQKRNYQKSLSKRKQKETEQKKIITVKEMINNQYQSFSMQPTQRNLEELKIKKQIAENSLKLAQKKYEKQIDQAKIRLQRLKQQSEMLQMRISDKKKQKEVIERSKKQGGGSYEASQYGQFRKSKKINPNTSLSKNRTTGSHGSFKLQPINK